MFKFNILIIKFILLSILCVASQSCNNENNILVSDEPQTYDTPEQEHVWMAVHENVKITNGSINYV